MLHTVTKPKTPVLVWWALTLLFFLVLLVRGARLSLAAYDALLFSAKRLIPSLFPFAVVAKVVASLPTPSHSTRIPLLRLPLSALPALFLGLISGYPMGAIAAKGLYDNGKLSRTSAEVLSATFNNASLAFLLFTVAPLFSNTRLGAILFASQTLASLCVAVLVFPKEPPSLLPDCDTESKSFFEILGSAVTKAAQAMLTLSAFVTFFAILAEMLAAVSPLRSIYPILLLFLEPTAALRSLARAPTALTLPLAAFTLGFSGLSVLLQSLAVWNFEASLQKSLLIRLFIGVLSALFALFFEKIL